MEKEFLEEPIGFLLYKEPLGILPTCFPDYPLLLPCYYHILPM